MSRLKYSTLFLCGALTTYCIISKLIFEKVYITSKVIVDEEFHLQLGKAYCTYDFDKWHPKVTTLPGLYILTSLLLGGFHLCSTYWLRFVSLIFSFINIILFHHLLALNNNKNNSWKNVFSAINLGLLPPLYFFSHVYYTDITSLTMVLITLLCSQKNCHYLASIFGFLAVLFRQTNIIWIAMVCACYILNEMNLLYRKKPRTSQRISKMELIQLANILKTDLWTVFKKTSHRFWLNIIAYSSPLIFFLVFLYVNGSIVVGDKSAHEIAIHIPQLFYFSVFCLFFAWPHFIMEIFNFFKFITNFKIFSICTVMLSLVIIHFNTLVHPYMLADNRHYVFYIWNRFYGKYFLIRYLMVILYLFSWFVIIKKIWDDRNITFLVTFVPCTIIVLITQKLIELRYFFIPYVLFRIRLNNVETHLLVYEFLTYCILNICTLYIFFTKAIYWEDYNYPQRLIW